MTDSNRPKSSQEWATYLKAKPLPSPFRVGKFVLQNLEKEALSYHQLAKIINRDPVLSFNIITYVNHKTERTNDADPEGSKTLSHAISMLGIEKLKETIQGLPQKAISSTNITSFYYLKTLCTSLYAGHLARAISIRKNKGKAEDIYWSSLFLGAPIWYLWRFATPEMRLVRYAVRYNFKHPKIAEEEVLGDNLFNISKTISKEFDLPKLAQECYAEEYQLSLKEWVTIARSIDHTKTLKPIDNRQLKIKMQSPHFVIMLANLLAHYSTYCWYSQATLRAQRILAYYLECSLEEAIMFSHEVAVDMSRSHPLPGLMLPASKLLIPSRRRTKVKTQKSIESFQESTFDTMIFPKKPINTGHAQEQRKNNQNVSPSTIEDSRTLPNRDVLTLIKSYTADQRDNKLMSSSDTQKTGKNNLLFDELTNIMANTPEKFIDFHELMNASTQGIAYGINLKRSFVAFINKDNSRFKAYYSVGCSKFNTLKNFESNIPKGSIFHKMIERPASIWVKPTSEPKIKNLIPSDFKEAINVDEFFLMSVFVGKKPIAIFYADNLNTQALSEQDYQQFKFLCGAVSSALQYQAKNKKNNSK